jgi:hypothetical protein
MKVDETLKGLSLLLIYLTSWEEDKRNAPGKKVTRAWKGYRFEVLDELQQGRLISQVPGGKSLTITDEGIKKAKELKKKMKFEN